MKRGIALVLTLAFAAAPAQAQSISGGGTSGGGGITFSGSVTNGNCPQIASSSQLSDSGAPCGGGLSSIANDDVMSNITGSSHAPSGNTLTATIDAAIGSTRGSLLERGASGWALVAPGTSGYVFTSNGSGADPSYQAASGGGSGTVNNCGTSGNAAYYASTGTAVSCETLSAMIDALIGSTRGAILERGASGWTLVTPGTSGFVFTSNGGGADPSYQAAAGAVASVSGTTGQVTCSPTTGSVVCGLPGTITQATTFSGGLASSGLTTESGGFIQAVTSVTSGASYTALTGDRFICVNKGTGSATTLNLISSPATGRTYTIKDCKGDAATNNITVTPASGNIDGGATYVMATNHQAITVVYDGTQWEVY